MTMLRLIGFQFLLFLCALTSKIVVFTININATEELYVKLRNESKNFSFKFINKLDDTETSQFIQEFVTTEHMRNQLTHKNYNKYDLMDYIEKKIVSEYNSYAYNTSSDKYELRRFLDDFIYYQDRNVRNFLAHLFSRTYNMRQEYNELLDEYNKHIEDIDLLKKSFHSAVNEIKEYLTDYDDNGNGSVYSSKYEEYKSKTVTLKQIEKDFKNKENDMKELLFKLTRFNSDVDRRIVNYKNYAYDVDTYLLDNFESIIKMFIKDLYQKFTSLGNEIKSHLNYMSDKIITFSKVVKIEPAPLNNSPPSKIHINYTLDMNDVKIKYGKYIKAIKSIASTDSKGIYFYFEKLIHLLVAHVDWIEHQNPYSFCQRTDITEALSSSLEIATKLQDLYIIVYNNYKKLYEKLYQELHKYLYDEKYNAYIKNYIYAWNDIDQFPGEKYLMIGNRLMGLSESIRRSITKFKESNKHLNEESFKIINNISYSLQVIIAKVEIHANKIYKFIHKPEVLLSIRTDFEYTGKLFREKLAQMKTNINSFEVASEQYNSEVDDLINLISTIINNDNIVEEFKKIRKVWRSYVGNTYRDFKKGNTLFDAYKKDKNIIFPPELGLTKSKEINDIINKNVLATTYFNQIYKEVITKFDSFKTQNEMISAFSTVYRSMDSAVELIKEKRKILRSTYNKKRKDILELIEIKNFSKKNSENDYVYLLELEAEIMGYMLDLFQNRLDIKKYLDYNEKIAIDSVKNKKVPAYCAAVENFIPKYFLTMKKWKHFIRQNQNIIPSNLICKIENI